MRHNIHKSRSTKAERRVYEILKELGIPFKHRWIIDGREIDFVLGKYVIEVDGHPQGTKNSWLAERGYVPIHFSNTETKDKIKIKQIIKRLC